jgi:twitching motility protein PilT
MSSDPATLLLGRLALHYKLVTQEQLVRAARMQAQEGGTRRLGEILVAEGYLSPRDLERLLVAQREVAARQEAAAAPAPAAVPVPAQPVAPGLAALLGQAVERGASDVHLHSGAPVQLRVHGRLEPLPAAPPLAPAEAEGLVDAVLSPGQRAQLAAHGQVDLALSLPGIGRFRGNVYRQQRGLDAVFRAIPAAPPTLESLGLPRALARFANYHQGMVLFTGPAGCGKSATMAAMVHIVNEERRDHIITIEDPIEVLHPSRRCLVNQRQVGRHTGSFARALRAALREDPDVLVIGELRDLETISLALTAAETGHLVFATLHTNNAVRTVNRLVGVFPTAQQAQIRTMVSESLRAVVSQRLLLRAGGGGRVPALEVLVNNKAVANLIRDSKTFQIRSVLQTGVAQGMALLDASLAELVRAGTVTREEALLHAEEPQRLMGAAA